MEFTRLADVEVVETANDTDKVLIEQNGEIKRVLKTEVGGSGNVLVIDVFVEYSTNEETGEIDYDNYDMSVTSNMSFEEALSAFNNRELTGAFGYTDSTDTDWWPTLETLIICNTRDSYVVPCMQLWFNYANMSIYWTSDGFSQDEPAPAETQ